MSDLQISKFSLSSIMIGLVSYLSSFLFYHAGGFFDTSYSPGLSIFRLEFLTTFKLKDILRGLAQVLRQTWESATQLLIQSTRQAFFLLYK